MDKNEDKKPWDDTFSDDRNQDGNLSRVELRKQKGNFKLILAVLISIVALIAIFSLAFGMSKQSSIQQSQPSTQKKAKKVTKPKHNHKTDKQKHNESKVSATKDDNQQTSDLSTSQTSSEDLNQSSTDDAKYTTVNQSEGIYRVAKNAGISVSQLQALNGLNDNSVITPGQRLRIK
ncbi:SAG1386/EF1546 family surface-associated protein [Fructilactobacillus frigidiflavus]|uniref:SAG1386/EF1546 family surface-associated protein n=1 Tax=Fructilactobacillus frigidiflavus TaxID=3242688 RepID=UPI0037583F3D